MRYIRSMRASVSLSSFLLLCAASPAAAEPARFVVELSDAELEHPGSVDFDGWLEDAAGMSAADATSVEVSVRLPDGSVVPAESLLPAAPTVPSPPAGIGVDNPGASTGFLSGKTVYMSQCHGWIWYDSLGRFSTQRGNLYDTVEDFHNPEGADAFLIRYLENAGATVVTMRERDHNAQMVIVDNGGSGYAESGSGFEDGASGYGAATSWGFGDNPFENGGTRRFPSDSGASATFAPTVPAAGDYGVYISYQADGSHDSAAVVRITHPGGVIERTVDQTAHGSTWVYLETLWLPEGSGHLSVEVAGSGSSGRKTSVDAVRIGGGMGDVIRNGTTTGRPRWEEGAILYTQYNGAPTSVYDPYGDRNGSDPSARSRYAAWRHPAGEDAVYLSWHSNAGGGRGTSTYTYEGSSGPAVTGSEALGQSVQDEIVSAMRALWDGSWTDRGHRTAAFSEVSPYHNSEMPSALVELAFHDQADDVVYLKDPAFRRDASRAMMRGIVRYFAERDGTAPAYLPEPPAGVSVLHVDGALRVEWLDGPSGDPYGDAATGWRVYTSTDGRSWDNGTAVSDHTLDLDTAPGHTVFVRVTATNAGGESFPSEVVGARRMPGSEVPPVLVVAAFDRLDSGQLVWEDVPVLGDLRRMTDVKRLNPFDIVARQGRAIRDAGWYFDATSDDRLDDIDLSTYRAVIWAAGEESSYDDAVSPDQQVALRAYWEAGGTLWVSGSEVLWDLDYLGDATDQAFVSEVLGVTMASDDAGVESAVGTDILDGLVLDFAEADGAPYPNEYPDVLASERTVIAEYGAGSTAAVLGDGVAHFGFPVECIGDEDTRTEVAARVLDALVPDWEAPDLEPEPGDTGEPDDSGTPDDTDTPGTPDDTAALSDAAGPGDAEDLDKLGGCACSSASAGGSALAWLALAGIGLVRRRKQRSTP